MNRLESLTSSDLRRLADALDGAPVPMAPARSNPQRIAVFGDRTVAVEMDDTAMGAYLAEVRPPAFA